MSQEIEQLRFIVDRSLGSEKVPKALREADFELVTLDELYGKRGAEDKKATAIAEIDRRVIMMCLDYF